MLLTNPFFSVGAGLLARSGPSLQPVNPWGGITEGLLASQRAQAYQQDMEANKMRLAALKDQQERLTKRDEYLSQYGPIAQAFPDAFAKTLFKEGEQPTEWVTIDGVPRLVTPSQASALSMQGVAAPYEKPGTTWGEPTPMTLPDGREVMVQESNDGQIKQVGGGGVTVNNMTGGFKVPSGYMLADDKDPSKGVVPIPGGPATELTEAQSTSAGYLGRMNAAEQTISTLEDTGYNAANVRDYYGPNIAKTPEGQQYRQAQEDWVRAKLRKESGAVIGDEEMDREIKVYFPQPGDGEAVRIQKAAARRQAMKSMAISAKANTTPDGTEVSVVPPKEVNWDDM